LAAVFIYSFFRIPPAILSKVYSIIGITDRIAKLRLELEVIDLPDWVIYSLPDGLWAYGCLVCCFFY